jgi:alkylation response protein AidB-like acyl-CoA dehydrogenase
MTTSPPTSLRAPETLLPLLDRFRDFVEETVIPLERRFLAEGFHAVSPELEAARGEAKRLGLWAPQLPEAWGGRGLSLLEFGHVSEVLGRSPLGHYSVNCQAPDAGNLELLSEHGSEDQRQRWLGPLARGEIRSCFAMTEPERAGSNPVWMETTARRDGDTLVLDGHKWFASSADGAAFAVVMAVTEPEAPPHERASMILVPTDTPGYRLVRNLPVMGEQGQGWASHGEVRLEECRVPAENVLGGWGKGFRMAQARLGPGRIHHTMRWLGICERAFDLLCRRAVEREIEPGVPLGTRQTVQTWVAESRAGIDAARLLVLDTAAKIDREGARAARVEISLIKFFVAGVLQDVLDRAIQAHGGLGMTDLTPLAWFFRHERAARIYDGPDEVHKAVVARRILQRYGLESRRSS